MKLLGISGSLQQHSSNTTLLHTVRAIATDVDVVLFEHLAAVPAMNPDDEHVAPAVRELRELVASADAVILASPEYAHGVPGALKNALDWLVGTGELYGKPVAVLSAAPSAERGVHARRDLERTLHAQGARVCCSQTIASRGVDVRQSLEQVVQQLRACLTSTSTPR
jgi:chromate reductase, NAD(P)H dehydrogenase (quinone)